MMDEVANKLILDNNDYDGGVEVWGGEGGYMREWESAKEEGGGETPQTKMTNDQQFDEQE